MKMIFVLLAVMLLIPAAAFAQDRGMTREEFIEANAGGPAFLDAYWTSGSSSENGTEVDVGPGDGSSTLAVVLTNRGPSDITGITGRLALPDGFQATGKAAGTPAVATFNQLAKVGNTFTLFFDVDVLDSAKVGEYTARLSVDYSKFFETGASRNVEMNVDFRVTGEAIVAVSRAASDNVNASSQVAAGKIEDFTFSVANRGTAPITSVTVTIESPSDSLKILGDTKWTVQRIEENSKVDLPTKVFAASSLIGNPASFEVTVEYSTNGEISTEKFALGTYVAGEISIRAYDNAIEYIGGEPNIVGNLLNEGNTVALFTTIEITGSGDLVSDLPPSQYIGDLEENSPLPFSIPIDVGSSGAGAYPVSLRITYKDDLRETHALDIDSKVQFVPERPADESNQNTGIMSSNVLIIIGIVVAAGIAAAVGVSRRRKSALKRTFQAGKQDDDIESVLDSHKKDDRK